jgi:hypothetical protein
MVLIDPNYSSHKQPLKLKLGQLRLLKMQNIGFSFKWILLQESLGVINLMQWRHSWEIALEFFLSQEKKFELAFGVLQCANAWSGVVSLEYIARWLIKKCGF